MPRVIAPVLLFAWLCAAQSTGSVEGVVVDRVTGAGIPGASVTFYIRTQGVLAEATTDASGEFRIFGMKPGSYQVRFEKEGYRFGNKIPPQPYIAGQSPSPVQIRLEMTRLVSLSGRVVEPDGHPMSQGEVRLVDRNTVPVEADGTFTFKDLEPGSYTLAAIPKPTRAVEGARVPVTTHSPALRITYKAATGSLQGTVENGGGATVFLIPNNVHTMAFGRRVTCRPDGTFEINGVAPGDYSVTAFEPFQRTFPTADAAWLTGVIAIGTRVSVGQTAVSVQLKLNPSIE